MTTMNKNDLVNEKSLSSTVHYDTRTRLWMQYVLSSPLVSDALNAVPASKNLYKTYNKYCFIGLITLLATTLSGILVFFAMGTTGVSRMVLPLLLLLLLFFIENRKTQSLVALSKEFIKTLFNDMPPEGTLCQFGEDVARRYKVASFVDFSDRLDNFLKRAILTGYVLVSFIFFSADRKNLIAAIIEFSILWPLLLRLPRILRLLLRLP